MRLPCSHTTRPYTARSHSHAMPCIEPAQTHAGAWNRKYGLLFIDQPIGTGFSPAGSRPLAPDVGAASIDAYLGLLAFFAAHPELQQRPFFITGEVRADAQLGCRGAGGRRRGVGDTW